MNKATRPDGMPMCVEVFGEDRGSVNVARGGESTNDVKAVDREG